MTKYIWSIILVFIFVTSSFATENTDATGDHIDFPSHYFSATYFHNSYRCPTCHKIESWSGDAITSNFADELKSGTLVWRTINVDDPENQHYNKDYQLYTKSLIISEVKDGKEIRWKNLEKVWTFIRNEEAFEQYVTSEIKTWIGQ